MIYAKPSTTVRAAIAKLCERRNLDINMVDVYNAQTEKVPFIKFDSRTTVLRMGFGTSSLECCPLCVR